MFSPKYVSTKPEVFDWIEVKGIGRQENQGAAVLWGKPANMCQVPKRKKYKEIRAHKNGYNKTSQCAVKFFASAEKI